MSIYVSGSLAFDRIMNFHGNFQDHVLMDKLHMLNISFMVDDMIERRGGCAGNIAYTLALLGEKPIILGCGGRDFDSYADHLKEVGLSVDQAQGRRAFLPEQPCSPQYGFPHQRSHESLVCRGPFVP